MNIFGFHIDIGALIEALGLAGSVAMAFVNLRQDVAVLKVQMTHTSQSIDEIKRHMGIAEAD